MQSWRLHFLNLHLSRLHSPRMHLLRFHRIDCSLDRTILNIVNPVTTYILNFSYCHSHRSIFVTLPQQYSQHFLLLHCCFSSPNRLSPPQASPFSLVVHKLENRWKRFDSPDPANRFQNTVQFHPPVNTFVK